MGGTMVKCNTMINGSYLENISKIRSKDLDIDEMESLLVEIFQHGIDLSRAYCEAVKRSKEDEEIRRINNSIWEYEKGYVDFISCKAKVNDLDVDLGYIGAMILKVLVKHKGDTVDRSMMIDKIWGNDAVISSRTIDAHVCKLKKRLLLDDSIICIRSIGYMLK